MRRDRGIATVTASWSLTTPPTIEPLSLDDLKGHLRVTHDRENAEIQEYGRAARRAAETYMSRGVMAQTWTLALSEWSDDIPLPMAWPLSGVASVKYYEPEAGALTTLSSSVYTVDTVSVPGRVRRAPGQSWPAVQCDRAFPIEIAYVVGVDAVEDVDGLILQGIRMHAAYLHLDREGMSQDAEAARKSAERCWELAGVLHAPDVRCH